DQRTRDRLAAMTHQPTAGELADKPSATPPDISGVDLDPRCLTGRVMCVSKTTRQLAWVDDGEVLKVTDARFGCSATATCEGVFQVGGSRATTPPPSTGRGCHWRCSSPVGRRCTIRRTPRPAATTAARTGASTSATR